MTALSLVVLIASALAGAVANAKQSGQLPASWVPYATIVGAFVAAFGASLGQAGSLTAATLLAAAVAGVEAVFAAGAGVGLHLHFKASAKAIPASNSVGGGK